jgi:UDP-N-acetylmuramoyl-tripeptide--D-alanyl-D-alanine ligase
MAISLTTHEILSVTGGHLVSGEIPDATGSICGDISELQTGQWFIALPHARVDAHDLLDLAVDRGAIGCIVVDRERFPFYHRNAPLIAVASTLQALYSLARFVRERINPAVIAITGSSGKSTTRDMCSSILSTNFKVHSSRRPDSRAIAESLLALPDNCQVLITEAAQKGRGHISWLGSLLRPDIAVVTNIGLAHLETLGSVENVTAAKCELLESLKLHSGVAVLGDSDEKLLARAKQSFEQGRSYVFNSVDMEEIAVTPETTLFSLSGSNTIFELRAHGEGYMRDAWCAIMCARQLGMAEHEIAEGLRRYTAPRGRGNRLIAASGALIIDESHSATPDSVRAAVTAFLDKRAVPYAKKYLVLGEMQELGEASEGIHAKLGKWLSELSFDGLLTLGDAASHILRGASDSRFKKIECFSVAEVCKFLKDKLDSTTSVLVDGSDSLELRSVVENLSHLCPKNAITETKKTGDFAS